MCLFALNPYARAHGALISPFAGIGLAMAAAGPWLRGFARRALWVLLFAGLSLWAAGTYGDSYSHFAELLLAKLRFLNVKPLDPARLNFAQRILWTPALNSANWVLTVELLPVILLLSLLAVIGFVRLRDQVSLRMVWWLPVFFGVSLLAYFLFVRFHVFTALFGAAWLGLWADAERRAKRGWAALTAVLLAVGWVVDACHTVNGAKRWGRPGIYYEELNDLVAFLREQVSPSVALANFGVSGPVLAYGNCPIILHPKFETRMIRDRVQAYGEHLFTRDEKAFRDWADDHRAEFYIHSLGEFSSSGLTSQMRYMVNAIEPPPQAAARLFEFAPDQCRYFRRVWSNAKYQVFDMLTRAEEARAQAAAGQAYEALCSGAWSEAEALATEALRLDLHNPQAARVLLHLQSLREQGVSMSLMSNVPLKTLAITGGIACGKSEVGRILCRHGVDVCDTDELARKAVLPGSAALARIVERFGPSILQRDGSLDRPALGRIVFERPQDLAFMNELLHPVIRDAWQAWQRERTEVWTAVLIPLLFEIGETRGWRAIICVAAPDESVRQRLRARGLSETEAEARIKNQWDVNEKKQRSDFVIENNGTLNDLEQKTLDVLRTIQKETEHHG